MLARRLMLATVFFLMVFSTASFVAGADIAVEEEITQSLSSDLINVLPKSITYMVGGIPVTTDISSTSEFTTDSGGKIRVDVASPWINEEEVQIASSPTKVKENGETYHVYRSIFPFEFDFNVYTSFDYHHVSPTGNIYKSTDAQNEIVIGRGYLGDELTIDKQSGGAKSTSNYDTSASGTYPVPRATNDVLTVRTGTAQKAYNIFNMYLFDYYNDGDDNFRTYDYFEWRAHVPYYYVGGTIGNSFPEQYNAFQAHMQSPAVDIGSFTLDFSVNVMPVIGLGNSIEVEDVGTLNLDSTWVSFTKAEDLVVNRHKGLVQGVAEGSFENFITSLPQDQSNNNNEMPNTADSQPSALKSNVATFASSNNPVTSQIVSGGTLGGSCDYYLGQPIMYSVEKQKNLNAFTTAEQKQILNLTQWELKLNSMHVVPEVELAKKVTNVDYKEQWYDKDIGAFELYFDNSQLETMEGLGGWNVYNTYVHQRMRLYLTVYSKFKIEVLQTSDAGTNSQKGVPEDPIAHRIWDNTNYGTQRYKTEITTENPINDFLNGLFGLDLEALIPFLIIGLIAVVVIIVLIRMVRGAVSGGGSGYGRPPQGGYGYGYGQPPPVAYQQQQSDVGTMMLFTQLQALTRENTLLRDELSRLRK